MPELQAVPDNLRERKKLALRRKIIDQTLILLASQGTEEITIDAICEGADISRKTFYNYYGTKHDLLFDICVSRLLELLEESISNAIAQHSSLAARLSYVIHMQKADLIEGSEMEREIARYSIASIGNSLASGATLLSVMNENFLRLFEASAGDIQPQLSAAFCAEMTVGMIDTVILNSLHNPDYDAASRYDELLAFLLSSLIKP